MNSPDKRCGEAGYALLMLVFLAALLLVALAAAVPQVYTEGMREKEEELIFRGRQWQTAIGRYFRKFGRYPNSIEELLRTNDRGYLRKPFADPMTKDGKWRLIGIGPGGAFIGSGRSPVPGAPAGPTPPPTPQGRKPGDPPPMEPQGESGRTPYPIAGVASRSRKPSIRIYEGATTYDAWEFIYDPTKDPVLVPPGGVPGGPGQPPGGQPGPGQPKPPAPRSPAPLPQPPKPM